MRARRIIPAAVLAVCLAVPAAEAAYVLTDVYIPMDDGVSLAADVYLPDEPANGPWPCLVELTPYRKEPRAAEGASVLPDAGFGLVEVDARGTGGSEGEYDIVFSVREQWDTAAVIDWAAEQSWCTEKVGMFGGSYSGIIQYLVASLDGDRAPEHLEAIAPQRAYGDLYRDIVYHGGQVIAEFGVVWSAGTSAFYYQPPTNVTTEQGTHSWLDHILKNDVMILPYLQSQWIDARFRSDDSPAPGWSQDLYLDSSVLPRIGGLDVPTLHLAGWFDSFTRGQLLTFRKAHARFPDRNCLIVGPWNHGGTHFVSPENGGIDTLLEWYRYWLTDDPERETPACLAEPENRVHYYEIGGAALANDVSAVGEETARGGAWHRAPTWPPPGITGERLYLRAGGSLTTDSPEGSEGGSTYVWNPASGHTDVSSRWLNAAGAAPHIELDQRTDEVIGLTFDTGPLEEDLVITGPIVLNLWATTWGAPGRPELAEAWPGVLQAVPPYHDTDFVVKLSEYDPETDKSTLVTHGFLRASHRAESGCDYALEDECLIPVHPHTLETLEPPEPGQPARYSIEVWPIAKRFEAGRSLRLTISATDTPNHLNILRPAAVRVLHRAGHESYLTFPVR